MRFELVDSMPATGRIDSVEIENGSTTYVSGRLSQPEAGRFFFQKQNVDGVAGEFVGIVEFPGSGIAYRLEPVGPGSNSELVERSLDEVECHGLPRGTNGRQSGIQEIPPLNPDDFPNVPIPDHQNGIVVLESLPDAPAVIYLDFQGGYTPAWGGVTYARPTLSNSQIRETWKRVAEDFMPFKINVTTDLKVFQMGWPGSRQHVIITPTDTVDPGAGGAAYQGSFNWSSDTPCWVFQVGNPKYCAEACSHEAGHTLGLTHSGQFANGQYSEYFYGQGSGETGWAPIMGVGYYANVTQWSKGEYAGANNRQDQLNIIVSQNNNVHYRLDDTGDSLVTSRYLEIYDDCSASAEGVIETTGETDAFRFTSDGGTISLRASPVNAGPNLAIHATLYDSAGNLLASNNPQTTLWASVTTNLPAGTYTFRVAGTGRNDPLSSGFSAYASVGYYSITGVVANARRPDRFVIPEHAPNGTVVGRLAARNPSPDPLTYSITSGNSYNIFALDDAGTLVVRDNGALDYQLLARDSQLPVQVELFVDIVDAITPALTETNRRVVVAITNVMEPPGVIAFIPSSSGFVFPHSWQACPTNGCRFDIAVADIAPAGTAIAYLELADRDHYSLSYYSIASGDTNSTFSIDKESGVLSVARSLIRAPHDQYLLTIVVSDPALPTSLACTSYVAINVSVAYPTGGISYAGYTNIAGILISDLTNASSFPLDPGWQVQAVSFEATRNQNQDYGAAMRGYLFPIAPGEYTFAIASQGESELWLSSSSNPADAKRIAFVSATNEWPAEYDWTRYPTQVSSPVALDSTTPYYVEARLKAKAGTNHLAVAWQCPDIKLPLELITGQFLSPFFMNYVPHPIGFTVNLHQGAFLPPQALGTVLVQDLDQDGQTFGITAGNDQGLFTIDPHSGLVSVANQAAFEAATNTHYTLQIVATDTGAPPLSGRTTVNINLLPADTLLASSIQQETWQNLSVPTLGGLTNHPSFPKRPDVVCPIQGPGFCAGVHGGCISDPTWGSRVRALVTPANTGIHRFFLASADTAELKFAPAGGPESASVIASVDGFTGEMEWTKYQSQQSDPIWLEAGQKYYLETLQVAWAREGFVSVGWAGPGLSGTNVIDRSFLSPVDIEYAPELPSMAVQLDSASANGTLVAKLAARDSPADWLAYKLVSGNVSNAFAVDLTGGDLYVANNSSFATHAVTNFELVVRVQDSGYGGLFPLKTAEAIIRVQIVDTAVWAGAGPDDRWSSPGNWATGLPKENDNLSFGVANRPTNRNDFLASVGTVNLDASNLLLSGGPLVLNQGLVNFGDNNLWAMETVLNRQVRLENDGGPFAIVGVLSGPGGFTAEAWNAFGPQGGAPGSIVVLSANRYTGPTVITLGTLILSNASAVAASSTIEVRAPAALDVSGVPGGFDIFPGQTLGGDGTVLGGVTVTGTLAPASSLLPSLSRLTFSNSLVLAGDAVLPLQKSSSQVGSRFTASVRVLGDLMCGGVLNVTNVGSAPALGDTFVLFEAARLGGSFVALNLPQLSPGLRWDASRLTTDGSVEVVPEPAQIVPVISANGRLSLGIATAPGATYLLESAPSLALPWTSTSIVFPGTGEVINTNVAILPSQPQLFFRFRIFAGGSGKILLTTGAGGR